MAKVLVVDDDHSTVVSLREVLRPEHDVEVACEGSSAICSYESGRPDIVLLDLLMPDVSGVEIAAGILAFDPAARIVIYTCVDQIDQAKKLLKSGACDYLVKPCSPDDIRRAIANALPDPTERVPDYFETTTSARCVDLVCKARSRGDSVFLSGQAGVGKRTVLQESHSRMGLGRPIHIDVFPGEFRSALRQALCRLDDPTDAICLGFQQTMQDLQAIRQAVHVVVGFHKIIHMLRTTEERKPVFVSAIAKLDTHFSGSEHSGERISGPGLVNIYCPSPSERIEDLVRLYRHFRERGGNTGLGQEADEELSMDSLKDVMSRDHRLDNVRFLMAAAIDPRIVAPYEATGLAETLSPRGL
ncbi:MAG: response regulator [Planctomycetota bacterium]|jgi:CheY-like chemotaxis protein